MHKNNPVLFDNEARDKILKGSNVIYEAVRRTMGPQGGNALIYGLYSRPYRLTNDGHTTANIIELKNPHEKLAASAIQDAANRTNQLAGDATSSTVVIAGTLINTVIPMISERGETADIEKVLKTKTKSRGVMDIKKELFDTRDEVVKKLKKGSKNIKSLEDLVKIATVSVEHEEYGQTISAMSLKVGTGGCINIVVGYKEGMETEVM